MKMRREGRDESPRDEVARAIDAALSGGIVDAHAARRVHQNRHNRIVQAVVCRADRAQQEQ
jgi:hypothetical protein